MNDTKTQQYRVLATTSTQFGTKVINTSTMWEGTDIDELSRLYPPSDIFGADDLFQKEIEGGFIITQFTFEQFVPGGDVVQSMGIPMGYTIDHWEEIDDPRRRLTPMTDLERAIDAENRRDFPGDYITECQDCGYDDCQCDYRFDCTDCDDHGCPECQPVWCEDCNDAGCATCDPDNVCPSCKHYRDPYHEPLNPDTGLCQGCEYYASFRECDDCGTRLTDGNKGTLCAHCEYDRSRPTCSNDCPEFADGDDGLCSGCRYYAETRCSDCDYNLPQGDDTLCSQCRDYDKELARREHWYWRLAYWLVGR